MPFYSISFILLVVCAIFYYRAGEFEGSSGILWAGISLTISMIVWRVFRWGVLGIMFSQAVLFIVITIFRKRPKP